MSGALAASTRRLTTVAMSGAVLATPIATENAADRHPLLTTEAVGHEQADTRAEHPARVTAIKATTGSANSVVLMHAPRNRNAASERRTQARPNARRNSTRATSATRRADAHSWPHFQTDTRWVPANSAARYKIFENRVAQARPRCGTEVPFKTLPPLPDSGTVSSDRSSGRSAVSVEQDAAAMMRFVRGGDSRARRPRRAESP